MGKFLARLDEKVNFLEIFRNFRKIFLRKLRKIHDFSVFFKRVNELCGNFSRVWTKMQIVENFEKNFQKLSKKFLRTIAKNALF